MDYASFCSEIFKSDSKIRFVAVYDTWANKVAGGLKEGVKSQLSTQEENELVNLSILNWQSRKSMSKPLGKTIYTLAEHETIKRFSFYLGDDYLLLLSTEKDADTNAIVDKVIKLYHKINQK